MPCMQKVLTLDLLTCSELELIAAFVNLSPILPARLRTVILIALNAWFAFSMAPQIGKTLFY